MQGIEGRNREFHCVSDGCRIYICSPRCLFCLWAVVGQTDRHTHWQRRANFVSGHSESGQHLAHDRTTATTPAGCRTKPCVFALLSLLALLLRECKSMKLFVCLTKQTELLCVCVFVRFHWLARISRIFCESSSRGQRQGAKVEQCRVCA